MARSLKATDKLATSRLVGVNTFMKLPLVEDVDELTDKDIDYAIVGIPSDNGAGYRVGQRFAPNRIRETSAMLRAINMEIGTNIDKELLGFDNGDAPCNPYSCELAQLAAYEKVKKLVARGIIPVCMGGDHAVTRGPLKAVGEHYGPVGLIHFDSHVDTWNDGFGTRYNNGTTLKLAIEEGVLDPKRTISIGIKGTLFLEEAGGKMSEDLGIEVITMGEFEQIGIAETVRRIRERVGTGLTYLTFDIDCMDPAFCPGGGVYELGGFTTREIIQILQGIKDLNIVGYDVCEVNPTCDVGDITSYTAAAFMHMFLAMIGVRKRGLQGK